MIKRNHIVFDRDTVDLRTYNGEILEINSRINEITLTSKGQVVNAAIVINKRKKSLILNIEDVILNSKNQIAIDFRGGDISSYKNKLIYKGSNIIKSENNIGVCISNNQKVEIIGEKESRIQFIGGTENPGIGNNKYTLGSGHLIFSKTGYVEVVGGGGSHISDNTYRGRDGASGINFEDSEGNYSSLRVLDNVEIKIIGGNGEDIINISHDKMAGNGGNAINIGARCIIEKNSVGLVELIGGNGGSVKGEYSCGNCGNGGSGINIKSGFVSIKSPASLNGGRGGSIDSSHKNIFSKGGKGGSCISVISSNDIDNETEIKIYDNVKVKGGLGGSSGIMFKNNNTVGVIGGSGGSFISSGDVKVKAIIGHIDFIAGIPGNGGRGQIIGKTGEHGKKIEGSKIINVVDENIDNIDFNINIQNKKDDGNEKIDITKEINKNSTYIDIETKEFIELSYVDNEKAIEVGEVEGTKQSDREVSLIKNLIIYIYRYIVGLFENIKYNKKI